MPDQFGIPEVDWSQQQGLLGGLTRLYQHLMGAGHIGNAPTQGIVNPQEYNPMSQVAQTGQMLANPSQHKMDWLMAAAPMIGGAVAKTLPKDLGFLESGWGEFATKPNDPVPPQYEGTNKSVIWQHPENPSVQIHHWPDSKTHPYKIFEHNHETGEDQLHYSAQTLDKAKDFANDLHEDLLADKTWDVQHPTSLPQKTSSPFAQKLMAQVAPEPVVKDYGLQPMARTASQVPTAGQGGIHEIINAKDSTYHATGAGPAIDILKAGQINPGYGEPLQQPGLPKGQDYRYGVSVSRTPRIASKGTRSVSFVVDPKALPPRTTPIAETGYGKTTGGGWMQFMNDEEFQQYNKLKGPALKAFPGDPNDKAFADFGKRMDTKYGPKMNRQFEFELRTPNKPVTMNDVKGIIVDRSALSPDDRNMLPQIQQMAKQRGLPYKEVANGKEMATYRAKMSKTPKGQPMYGVAGAATAAAPGAYQLYQQFNQPQQEQ